MYLTSCHAVSKLMPQTDAINHLGKHLSDFGRQCFCLFRRDDGLNSIYHNTMAQ